MPHWIAPAIGILGVLAGEVVGATHRQLKPWCKDCQDGGGWDDIIEPSPTPHPSTRVTL